MPLSQFKLQNRPGPHKTRNREVKINRILEYRHLYLGVYQYIISLPRPLLRTPREAVKRVLVPFIVLDNRLHALMLVRAVRGINGVRP